MKRQICSSEQWVALKKIASHYLNCGSSRWKPDPDQGAYVPALDHENHPSIVRFPAYMMIAKLMRLPHTYLANARYPSKNFRCNTSIHFDHLGYVRFTVYPSGGNPKGGLTRFWIVCPICGKECACGRFHQHIKVHMPDTWLLNVDGDENWTEHLYGLKKPVKRINPGDDSGYYPHRYYHRIIISTDTIDDKQCTRVYAVGNVTRVMHQFTIDGHDIEKCLANFLEMNALYT